MRSVFAHDHRFVRADGKYHSRGGLPEAVLARYAEAFGSVDVICRVEDHAASGLAPFERRDIRFYPQENIRSLSFLYRSRRVKHRLASLVSDADVVIARLPSLLGWMAAGEARRQNVPCLIEVVGNAIEASSLHGSALGRIAGRVEHWLTAREIRRAKVVVFITQQYLQSVYPTHGTHFVCPNVRIDPLDETEMRARHQMRPRSSAQKIGLIGSLDVNYKGHDVAINVLRHLRDSYGIDHATLEFAGGGDPRRWRLLAAELGVADKVRFHGSVPAGAAMMAWIDDMDILLQPSITEGQGRAIIEGMSIGCPVVAADVGGIPELLDSNWIAAPLDVEGLASRCARLLNSPEVYRRVSARNWTKALEFESGRIEKVRGDAFAMLRKLADDRRAGTGRIAA